MAERYVNPRKPINRPTPVIRPIHPHDYAKIESRQEQGFRLNGFLGIVTTDPHARIYFRSDKVLPRIRNYRGMKMFARTAKSPYRLNVRGQ